jgi:hypothetical protein
MCMVDVLTRERVEFPNEGFNLFGANTAIKQEKVGYIRAKDYSEGHDQGDYRFHQKSHVNS